MILKIQLSGMLTLWWDCGIWCFEGLQYIFRVMESKKEMFEPEHLQALYGPFNQHEL